MTYYQGKVIWITGASSGIGKALAKELYTKGAKLVISGRNQQALNELASKMEADRVFVQTFDATSREANHCAVAAILDHYQQLDIAIFNACISQRASLRHFADGFKETIDINLLAIAYGIEAVLPCFLKQKTGHIVAMASLAGFGGIPQAESYCASKAAVRSMMQGLSAQLYKTNIAVTTLCPGFVKTPLTDKNDFPMPFLMDAEQSAKIIANKLPKRKALLCYPGLFSGMVRFLNILPNSFYLWLMSKVR